MPICDKCGVLKSEESKFIFKFSEVSISDTAKKETKEISGVYVCVNCIYEKLGLTKEQAGALIKMIDDGHKFIQTDYIGKRK